MKLPNFLDWGTLNRLRRKMGAPLVERFQAQSEFKIIELPIVERLRQNGIDVTFDEIERLADGTLAYQGYRVLLYIRDIAHFGEQKAMPKFHVAYCGTLETMHSNKRFARYVVANREDGLFNINEIKNGSKSSVVKLDVCQVCLATIAWQNFRMEAPQHLRRQLVDAFSLQDFFQKYPRDLISVRPEYTSVTAPLNDYTPDWREVSENVKQKRGYECSKCHELFREGNMKYLHVHHLNGAKNDNSDKNLEVLCIRCHAEQPMHQHMKMSPAYREFIEKFR